MTHQANVERQQSTGDLQAGKQQLTFGSPRSVVTSPGFLGFVNGVSCLRWQELTTDHKSAFYCAPFLQSRFEIRFRIESQSQLLSLSIHEWACLK
jgi:hypothetical protein